MPDSTRPAVSLMGAVAGLALLVAAPPVPAWGQDPADSTPATSRTATFCDLRVLLSPEAARVITKLGELLAPDAAELLSDCPPLAGRVLRDLDLRLKTFTSADADDAQGFGLEFAYDRHLARSARRLQRASQSGMMLSLQARGQVAFQQRWNPNDYLDADLNTRWYWSRGGVIQVGDSAWFTRLNALEDAAAAIEDSEELLRSPAVAEFDSLVESRLSSQIYLTGALAGGMESDQKLDQARWVYGLRLGVAFRPWNRGELNLLDWPFAAIRYLSGYDRELRPRGSAFPTLLLGLERVQPIDDTTRSALVGDDGFSRFRLEAAFRTELAAEAYVEANYRYYRELDAPSAVRQADLATASYLTLAVVQESGLFLSYTTGKLPFDRRDDEVYALGFKFDF